MTARTNDDFAVMILTHGRADRVTTYRTLRDQGYTGRIIIVIDDEDEEGDEYARRFGEDDVFKFNKSEVAEKFDEVIRGDRRTIVYARNACFDIAERAGVRYFLELDDDYTFFCYNYDSNGKEITRKKNTNMLDEIFEAMLDFLKNTPVKSIAFSQGGDFIGGNKDGKKKIELKRKCMNSFFCDTERRFFFTGRINEDVNTYTMNASRGDVFFTTTQFSLNQKNTQKNKGGMTDVYLDSGTYLKSFFSIIVMPSAVRVAEMGDKHKRLHNSISWRNVAPKILREQKK